MRPPVWKTATGSLGTITNTLPVYFLVEALPVFPATSVTYNLIQGILPTGLGFNAVTGVIAGTCFETLNQTFSFTIQAVDDLGNKTNRLFSIKVSGLSNPVWITEGTNGSLGTFPPDVNVFLSVIAQPQQPATSLSYSLLSGNLPPGLEVDEDGNIFGTPTAVDKETSFTFVLRATDNLQQVKDKTFSISISGLSTPSFATPSGNIFNGPDSTWIEIPIMYNNPVASNPVTIRVIQGLLPPGVEINEYGLIRGYAEPPITSVSYERIETSAEKVNASTDTITCLSVEDFEIGRIVIFRGVVFGGMIAGKTYYINSVNRETNEITISATQDGEKLDLTDGSGYMIVELPKITTGDATIRTYGFTLLLESPLGNDIEAYNITIINQQTPASKGNPNPINKDSRIPTIYNTRPPTYDIKSDAENFSYYALPPVAEVLVPGMTYPISIPAKTGKFEANNYFSYKIMGHDFDGNDLEYIFADVPNQLSFDNDTGWIYGSPAMSTDGISEYYFKVLVRKKDKPSIKTPYFNFSFILYNNIDNVITWLSDSNLGTLYNGTVCNLKVSAESDVELQYRLTPDSNPLPPNINLLNNGELTGVTAFQPEGNFTPPGENSVFTFTVEAYSPKYPLISSTKVFTVNVLQEYTTPFETLYIKCTPDIVGRQLINSLLTSNELIPSNYLYRPEDTSFGKATNVTYQHAYGIHASNFDEYIASVTRNHYWRNITLGELETAIARDEDGNIIYEVVYSKVIDNLINPEGVSVNESVIWPTLIDLNGGPWYTSVTDIFTSYIYPEDAALLTQRGNFNVETQDGSNLLTEQGLPSFYTSLWPGYARTLYPNSLPNMRNRVGQTLGQEFDFRIYPAWMTSQQLNGSTLGYTPAWVIAYCKYDYVKNTAGDFILDAEGKKVTYAQQIKKNIETKWKNPVGQINKLNQINFQIDRFTVDKSNTYNYDKEPSPPAWLSLPSATPVPDPIDSKDFYVLFPRKTILPDKPQ